MHPKAIDQAGPRVGTPPERVTFTMPELVIQLQRKRLARPSEELVGMNWMAALQTYPMANWACRSSLDMIEAVLDLIPDLSPGAISQFKGQFSICRARLNTISTES